MIKTIVLLICCFFYVFVPVTFAQASNITTENTPIESQPSSAEIVSDKQSPQVGKHVMANMNASSMILSLLMVLGLIVISALVLKRFNLTQQSSQQLSVVASLSLGAKERVVVVQVGKQQLVLGVSPQQISLLQELETPIDVNTGNSLALSGNVLSFLQKNTVKNAEDNKTEKSEAASNETTRNH